MTVDESIRHKRLTLGTETFPLAAGNSARIQEVLALTRRWFIQLGRERLELIFTLIQPAIWLLFFGGAMGRAVNAKVIGTHDYLGFVLPGIIAFTIVGSGVTGAMPLLWDKETGYLDKLMSMPIARSSVIVSRFLYQLGMGSAQVALVLIVAFAMGVRIQAGPLGVLAILIVAALLTLAVVAAFAALAYSVPHHGTFFAITGFVSLPLLFISDAFVPLRAMPPLVALLAHLNPLTYAIDAIRILVLDGWSSGLLASLGALALFSLICLVLGVDQFRRQTGERLRG
jgi:ABC-2 type transport system permease protein